MALDAGSREGLWGSHDYHSPLFAEEEARRPARAGNEGRPDESDFHWAGSALLILSIFQAVIVVVIALLLFVFPCAFEGTDADHDGSCDEVAKNDAFFLGIVLSFSELFSVIYAYLGVRFKSLAYLIAHLFMIVFTCIRSSMALLSFRHFRNIKDESTAHTVLFCVFTVLCIASFAFFYIFQLSRRARQMREIETTYRRGVYTKVRAVIASMWVDFQFTLLLLIATTIRPLGPGYEPSDITLVLVSTVITILFYVFALIGLVQESTTSVFFAYALALLEWLFAFYRIGLIEQTHLMWKEPQLFAAITFLLVRLTAVSLLEALRRIFGRLNHVVSKAMTEPPPTYTVFRSMRNESCAMGLVMGEQGQEQSDSLVFE